ncbi:MAG: efflux RND transporter periplasmic adaptor subunit [Burkholderiaceae bacterium]|nr:efflux RND transporter periplasmic adaptor subunit [Burkholderiaceae bacterium]
MNTASTKRGMLRRHLWTALFVLLAVAAASWALPRALFGPIVPVVSVVQRDFVQSVVASGRVQAPHRIDIGAQITGTVIAVPVAEGQIVRAGQVLVELDATELKAALQQALTAVAQAQAKLRQLHEVQAPVAEQNVRQAQTTLEHARTQQRRNEELFGKGFIGQATLDDSRKNVELADAQLRAAQRQLESARAGGSDVALAETALAQARANADAARARLSYATITAPVAGTLIGRNVERGDVVQPGKVLMTLSPSGDTQLVVQIDEKNLALLASGQHAIASADAYPGKRFDATLAYINPGVNAQTGAVEVKLDVPDPPPELRQDMTVSVDIEVARRQNAVLVPTDAVRQPQSASPWVLRVVDGRAQRAPVRVGLRSGGWSEVLEGVEPGDLVVPAGVPDVVDGMRVRPRVDAASPE